MDEGYCGYCEWLFRHRDGADCGALFYANRYFGEESKAYHGKLTYAKNNAILRATEESLTLGANMILGMQVNITEISALKGMLQVAVIGTALKHDVE